MTLHFFGEISAEEIHKISSILSIGLKNEAPFQIALEGVGFFPDERRPRIVWLGLRGDTERLIKIQEALQKKVPI